MPFTLIPTSLTGDIFYIGYMKQYDLYTLRVNGLVYATCAKEISDLFITTVKVGSLLGNLSSSSKHSLNCCEQGPKISIEYCSTLGMPQ